MGGLTLQALTWGADSPVLNPQNLGQSWYSCYFGKPLRAVARLIHALTCATILPELGVMYYGLRIIHETIMYDSRNVDERRLIEQRVVQYANAFKSDLKCLALMICIVGLVALTIIIPSPPVSSSIDIRGPITMSWILTGGVSLMAYTLYPNVIRDHEVIAFLG